MTMEELQDAAGPRSVLLAY